MTTQQNVLSSLVGNEWFAVQTRPRHEKVLTSHLLDAGIEAFLPLYPLVRSWSDRRKVVEFPLFPGYVFFRSVLSSTVRVRIFQARGFLRFVGPHNAASPIPDSQIDAVRSLIRARVECKAHPFLNIGERVRIRNGSLQGLEGILVKTTGDQALIVSIDLIHRSLTIRLDGYELERV